MRDVTCEHMVAEFNKSFGHPVDTEMTVDELNLRAKLLDEEFDELMSEIILAKNMVMHGKKPDNLPELLKELADLQYVLSGFAVVFGLPLRVAFNRVHKSNMSKLGLDGKPIKREDGKILKGPNYKTADLKDLV